MANRIIILLFALFALFSCSKRSDFVYTEIDNKDLKDQINLYINFIDSLEPNREKLVCVNFKKSNDSTVLFDVSNEIYQPALFKSLRVNFICQINH